MCSPIKLCASESQVSDVFGLLRSLGCLLDSSRSSRNVSRIPAEVTFELFYDFDPFLPVNGRSDQRWQPGGLLTLAQYAPSPAQSSCTLGLGGRPLCWMRLRKKKITVICMVRSRRREDSAGPSPLKDTLRSRLTTRTSIMITRAIMHDHMLKGVISKQIQHLAAPTLS